MKKLWWIFVPLALVVIALVAYAHREKLSPISAPTSSSHATSSEQASADLADVSAGPSVSFLPSAVIQGDPVEILVSGAASSSVSSIVYNGVSLDMFSDQGRPAAVIGIGLRARAGSYPVVVTLASGQVVKKSLMVGAREVATAPLGIPASLGGNTPQAAANLVSNLARDNAVLDSVPSAPEPLWSGAFIYPVSNPVVTDTYGYTRSTVDTTISHEGTDFRAPPGTPVYAMNSGTVALAQSFTSYGNTIVLDHGAGVQTLYLHLSEIDVSPGERVEKGELIGKSGETGYAEGPHLHLSIKIGGISIDPEKFLKLF